MKELEPDQDRAESALRSQDGGAPRADLEMYVDIASVDGRKHLRYTLDSPTDKVPYTRRRILGPPFEIEPNEYQANLFEGIEKLHAGLTSDGSPLLGDEIVPELEKLGRELYRDLFTPEMKDAYRKFREQVNTLHIISAESWIPWEIVRPYDDSDLEAVINDDFWCLRFQLTRWLCGETAPPAAIAISRLAVVRAEAPRGMKALGHGRREASLLAALADRCAVEDRSLASATFEGLEQKLRDEDLDLVHFVGHGKLVLDQPQRASFLLENGRAWQPTDLLGEVGTRVRRNRPLVFLNACQMAQSGWARTRLGGWAPSWIEAGCGAFIGPQWTVDDGLACAFAKAFYAALENDRTFGAAACEARRKLGGMAAAFSVYAHPNGRLLLPGSKRAKRRNRSTTGESTSQNNNTGSRNRKRADLQPGESIMWSQNSFRRFAPYAFGFIFIATVVAIAVAIPVTNAFQETILRIVLALAAAGIAGTTPKLLKVKAGRSLKVGGAMIIFLVVYFFNPAVLIVDGPAPLSINSISVESIEPAAEDWAVDTDPLLVSWLASGDREFVHVLLENVRTARRTKPLRISSSEGRVIFNPDQYREVVTNRDHTKVNTTMAVVQTKTNIFFSEEFDLHVGITIVLIGEEPNTLLASAMIDDSSESLSNYQCEIDVIGWTQGEKNPFFFPIKLRNPFTEVPISDIPNVAWDSLDIVYQGPDDERRIREQVMLGTRVVGDDD